jgi:hypothetical protein
MDEEPVDICCQGMQGFMKCQLPYQEVNPWQGNLRRWKPILNNMSENTNLFAIFIRYLKSQAV